MSDEPIVRIVDPYAPERIAHVVQNGALVPNGIRAPGDLVVGAGAQVQGNIEAAGHIHLAQSSAIGGNVHAGLDIVVGRNASIAGSVTSGARIFLLSGALIAGPIDAAGDVTVRPGVRCERIACGGDLRLTGPAETGELAVRGRIQVG